MAICRARVGGEGARKGFEGSDEWGLRVVKVGGMGFYVCFYGVLWFVNGGGCESCGYCGLGVDEMRGVSRMDDRQGGKDDGGGLGIYFSRSSCLAIFLYNSLR